jgi:endonuclease G
LIKQIGTFSVCLLIVSGICSPGLGYGQSDIGSNSKDREKIYKLEIPKLKPKEVVVTHTGYSISFNDKYKLANWVAYDLTKEETKGSTERTNKFIPDPFISNGTATDEDYQSSGYDRGHLAPAADMTWSSTAMAESFYYSNISPQDKSFNRGIWKKLETLVRKWAEEYDEVFIVTGPVLTTDLPTIGIHKVAVPKCFFKVILDYTEPGLKGIGFIIPNEKLVGPLQEFAITIDSVEKVTGINFFPELPDDQERDIESTININDWSWQSSKPTGSRETKSSVNSGQSVSVQCSEVTKSGTRCKRITKSSNGRCWQHGGN